MTAFILKVLGICITAAAVCVLLKKQGSEYALLVGLAAGAVTAVMTAEYAKEPINRIFEGLREYGVGTEYFKVALKALGIGYISSFIADSCRDCGETSLASKAEFAGKCAIFLLCCPLIFSITQTAVDFLK